MSRRPPPPPPDGHCRYCDELIDGDPRLYCTPRCRYLDRVEDRKFLHLPFTARVWSKRQPFLQPDREEESPFVTELASVLLRLGWRRRDWLTGK